MWFSVSYEGEEDINSFQEESRTLGEKNRHQTSNQKSYYFGRTELPATTARKQRNELNSFDIVARDCNPPNGPELGRVERYWVLHYPKYSN